MNELGRVLSRNQFALVDKTKFVTTTDLLNKISSGGGEVTGGKKSASTDDGNGGGLLQMATAAVLGMGVAAVATFLVMKSNN